jgi:hypothetical protein
MLRILFLLAVVFFSVLSCNDDIFETSPSTGELSFSKDTIYLDTVFSNISSSTRTFKIYNKSGNNITIPSIRLGRGENSFYRLNVNGTSGKNFENVTIFRKDSIYVFVEATIDFSKVTNPIYTDSIVFDEGMNQQDVKLVTLVQDAYFLYPKKDAQGVKEKIVLGQNDQGEEIAVEGFYLEGNAVWGKDKPYVIYGYVGVNQGNMLTIEKGARIHFHANSGLLVEKSASLKIRGTLAEKVIIQGDRLEPFYEDVAGQWGTIWLRAGSRNHEISHAMIKNNTIGLLVDSIGGITEPTLKIDNTEIYNTSNFGLLGRSAHIAGNNLVIGNNGLASLACTLGGNYDFTHCTFANFWSGSIREYPAVLVNNYERLQGTGELIAYDLLAANFTSCIMEGNQNIEFLLEKSDEASFSFNFRNSLLRFDDPNGFYSNDPLYDFDDMSKYQNNIFNGEPDFRDINAHDFQIGDESEANAKADLQAAQQVPYDILGVNRSISPDIGAYQHVTFE